MKTDRELLELAALAANEELKYDSFGQSENADRVYCYWNPLDNDGDAFRLSVKLGIDILRTEFDVEACAGLDEHEIKMDDGTYGRPFAIEKLDSDPCAATRLAVLRCAAAIGQSMKEQGK